MVEAEPNDVKSVAPKGALADELGQVADSAANLRTSLSRANRLPDDFPKVDLEVLAHTLEQAPAMSGEGALHALTYARPKLSQLRRQWVAIPQDDGDLPDVGRGGAIDQAMARLIADVDTAREAYDPEMQDRAEVSAFDDKATMPGGTPELLHRAERVRAVADQSGAIADEFAEGATPGSMPADNLVRAVRDVEVLTRQEALELSASAPRLKLIDQLNRAVGRTVPYVRFALRGVVVVADLGKIGFERFSNVLTRQITVILEEVSDGSAEIEQHLEKLRRKWALPDPSNDTQKAKTPGPKLEGLGRAEVGTEKGPHPSPLPEEDREVRASGRARVLQNFEVFRDIDAPWCPEMVTLPPGEFLMGSSGDDPDGREDERPQHRVTISRGFAIGRYPITFEEYDHFCNATGRVKPDDGGWGRGKRPVITVYWRDATDYCIWLSRETGRTYRLPAEAEWEYACRAGTATRYALGDTITEKQANFGRNKARTTEVGAYPANAWGLYDMHGNVWEWCVDEWRVYTADPVTDPWGAIGISSGRALRGGSWHNNRGSARSAFRIKYSSSARGTDVGFRVVCSFP